jgi:hypothetical protein
MDPYLEQFWPDIHARLIIYAVDQIQTQLPTGLRARVEERVYLESPQGNERSMYPDIRVVERGNGQGTTLKTEGGVGVAEPLEIWLGDEPVTETFIEIIDAGSGHRVITVIEFLSLSNKKPGEGQTLYLKKQKEMLEGKVNLVEIDLLRPGQRVLSVSSHLIPPFYRTSYQICVRRGWQLDKARIYRAPLSERLPIIKIPLRPDDPEALLDLQALITQCYQNGRYEGDIHYKADPDPPLDPPEAEWADQLLRSQGWR